MIPECQTCKFSHFGITDDGPVVECRRFPPVTAPLSDDPEEMELFTMHRFPNVLADDWCGEYQS